MSIHKLTRNLKRLYIPKCELSRAEKEAFNIASYRASFTFFQNLNLGKTSNYPKYHWTISLATSCQYQCVCKFHHNILHNSRDRAIFTFSEFGARQSLDQ